MKSPTERADEFLDVMLGPDALDKDPDARRNLQAIFLAGMHSMSLAVREISANAPSRPEAARAILEFEKLVRHEGRAGDKLTNAEN